VGGVFCVAGCVVAKYDGGRSKQAPLLGTSSAPGGITNDAVRSGADKPSGARNDGTLSADI
jgi:hypothetical protein